MKKITILIFALFLCVLMPITAQAEQLTETDPGGGMTEVTAKVIPDPGDVEYIVTIPDVVDFGTLTPPGEDVDSYRDVTYSVVAEKVEGLQNSQGIVVYVKDRNATGSDRDFYIVNKSNSDIKFSYNIYRAMGEDNVNEASRVNNGEYSTAGYYLCSFIQEGQTLDGTLRFNQRQLFNRNIADIVGDYSGYMEFYSFVESN